MMMAMKIVDGVLVMVVMVMTYIPSCLSKKKKKKRRGKRRGRKRGPLQTPKMSRGDGQSCLPSTLRASRKGTTCYYRTSSELGNTLCLNQNSTKKRGNRFWEISNRKYMIDVVIDQDRCDS